MQLLREWYPVDYKSDLVKEDRAANGGKLMLQGVIQRADAENQNRRIYPYGLLQREVENYRRFVQENRAVGELDHPESSTVSLDKVSHIVRDVWWDGKDVKGKIEVLGTPKGQILQALLDAGVTIGISSRGVGSTSKNESGFDIVQPDFQLICFDIVSEPSTNGAFLTLGEGKQIMAPVLSKRDRIFRAANAVVMRRK